MSPIPSTLSPPTQCKGVLYTVGGKPDPIVFSLKAICPEHVVLVCSNQTLPVAVEVSRKLKEQLPDKPLPNFTHKIVEHPQDLVDCHQTITQGLTFLTKECGLSPAEIKVDFTGGLKTMSAAAVLAAAPHGYEFLYVGGGNRTDDGIGVVVTGSEETVYSLNPWKVLEEPTLNKIWDFIDLCQWEAALKETDVLIVRADSNLKPMFDTLRNVILGLKHWDNFEHQKAMLKWDAGESPTKLKQLASVANRPRIEHFANTCRKIFKGLNESVRELDPGKPTTRDPLVQDLLANACRYAGRASYDEACLRIYRALELFTDRRLRVFHGIDNSNVNPESVPASLRSVLAEKHGEVGPWKLALFDSIALLAELGDKPGVRLRSQLTHVDVSTRNMNWLIHGEEHSSQNSFDKFFEKSLLALGINKADIPNWPPFSS